MLTYQLNNYLKNVLRAPYKMARRSPDALRLQVARAMHRVTGDATSLNAKTLYPPRLHVTSTPDWARGPGQALGVTVKSIDPRVSITHPMPKTPHNSVRRQLSMDGVYETPETFVATIPSGRVWGEGMVIAPDDTVLDDLSLDFHAAAGRPTIVREWRVEKLVSLDARVAVLATAGAAIYYHWFFQLLPRAELIRRAGMTFESIDYFLVNDLAGRFKRDSLKAIGIGPEKVLLTSDLRYVQARELVAPSIVLRGGCYPEWMRSFLRSTFLCAAAAAAPSIGTRRLYLSRGEAKYRRVLGEGALMAFLGRYGFETLRVETLSLFEQAKAMSEAAVVVAPHGAGLSNVVFCGPGTKVIEIFSPELVAGYYWKLCNECGLDYYYVLGKGRPETLLPDYQQSWDAHRDITVDIDLVEAVLAQAEVSPAAR